MPHRLGLDLVTRHRVTENLKRSGDFPGMGRQQHAIRRYGLGTCDSTACACLQRAGIHDARQSRVQRKINCLVLVSVCLDA